VKFISDVKRTSFYKKGQYIVFEGNQVLGLFFILSGKIKVVSSGLFGKSQVVRLTQSGDIIGHRGYGGETYPISAIALEDSEICFVDNDSIYKAFMNNPKLTFELMMYYSKELRNSEAKIKNLAQMSVREKVVDALLYSEKIFGKNKNSSINVQIDRQDLADLAGINTEQLSRVLSEFKKDDILLITKSEITINNKDQLLEIVKPYYITY
jgi:CRP-like cAMP-binding protein